MTSGQILRESIISGANNISNHKDYVNNLNVFPVPDGDTGSNMSKTMEMAKIALEHEKDGISVEDVVRITASALLRGARGNSGVILSLIFRGLSKGLEGKKNIDSKSFAKAFALASETAYSAVSKPTEGTILTVIRLVAQDANKIAEQTTTFAEFWEEVCDLANEILAKTPELLPVLAEANVVDSGGQGLVLIFEGMGNVFSGAGIVPLVKSDESESAAIFSAVSTSNEALTFYYCTEFLIKKSGETENTEIEKLKQFLGQIGDSVVVVDDADIIKVHVHTNHPGTVLEKALELGELSDPKINNLHEECEEKAKKKVTQNTFEYRQIESGRKFGFVAVVAGPGIEETFLNLGVDNVVSGGQTMNPSTEELVGAIQATPARTVFVLPNNKNIIMSAQQAALIADRDVVILPSRTIPQGISALLSFDECKELEANQIEMNAAIERVKTGFITFAARDSEINGKNIKKGDILAIEAGRVKFVEKDYLKAGIKLVKSMAKKGSYITVFYGEDVDPDKAKELEMQLCQKFSNYEINVLYGGQPVHHLIISVE